MFNNVESFKKEFKNRVVTKYGVDVTHLVPHGLKEVGDRPGSPECALDKLLMVYVIRFLVKQAKNRLF